MGCVLITGAAGFIGSHLAERLVARGERVIGLDNFDQYYDPLLKRRNLESLHAAAEFSLIEGDIRDAAAVEARLEEEHVETIIHLAALAGVRASVARAAEYLDVNTRGTLTLLEAAQKSGIRKLLLVSTSSVYGCSATVPFVETDAADRPLAPYPASKRAAELLAHTYHNLYDLPITVARLFSVYGPRSRPDLMPRLLADHLLHGSELQLFAGGAMQRDWTYIDDIVDGLVRAHDHVGDYEVFNLGRGEPQLLSEFVAIMERLSGRNFSGKSAPAPPSEPEVTFADIGKARRLLGYDPSTSLEDGLAAYWQWYMQTQETTEPIS